MYTLIIVSEAATSRLSACSEAFAEARDSASCVKKKKKEKNHTWWAKNAKIRIIYIYIQPFSQNRIYMRQQHYRDEIFPPFRGIPPFSLFHPCTKVYTNPPNVCCIWPFVDGATIILAWDIGARSQIPVYSLTGCGLGGRSIAPGAGFCGQNLGIKYIPCVGTHLWITMAAKSALSYCQIYWCE